MTEPMSKPPTDGGARLAPAAVHRLTLSTDPWLSCEDCFRLVDVYVEGRLGNGSVDLMPEMTVHLAGCPACAEEAGSLLELVAESDAPR
jgi:hypothetical protein